MDYPHRIRLRGPWECEPLASASGAPLPPPGRMVLPCAWGRGGLPDFAGRVRFRRRFGFPGRLDTFERVWVTCAGVTDSADVSLNGRPLGRREGAFEFEVTSLLQARNELVVEVDGPADRGGIWGEVALEVRCSAYLKDVEVRPEVEGPGARLRVTGRVVGTAERPLDLYALLDGATVAYASLPAEPAGRPFELVSEVLDGERLGAVGRHVVRVDLVNGPCLWYQFEQIIDTPGPR